MAMLASHDADKINSGSGLQLDPPGHLIVYRSTFDIHSVIAYGNSLTKFTAMCRDLVGWPNRHVHACDLKWHNPCIV